MKPNEQIELVSIVNAIRNLDDAKALLARGKRSRLKRIELVQSATALLHQQLEEYERENAETASVSPVVLTQLKQDNEAT